MQKNFIIAVQILIAQDTKELMKKQFALNVKASL